MERCTNAQVSAPRLETHVFFLLKEVVVDPVQLRKYLALPKSRERAIKVSTGLQLKEIELEIEKWVKEKREVLKCYARKEISREEYGARCKVCDSGISIAKNARGFLLETIPLFQKENIIDASVRSYCDTLKMRLAKITDFDSKRDLALEYIERISFEGNNMELLGAIPVLSETQTDNIQKQEIKFVIRSEIPPRYRAGRSH